MKNSLDISAETECRARKVLDDSGVIRIWEEAGAEVRIVGSLAMGLMMTHRDIDLHIYTDRLDPAADFAAMARLAANPAVERVTYTNLAATEE
ncbi:MAG: phosphoglycerate mutase family protein, partial [Alistipes sp.]|nr:phosphoglycerate mutase family protein [Alistipes sp.]